MIQFSVVIPLFNRPQEIEELLNSLLDQAFTNFEVIVVEDGSEIKSDTIIQGYKDKLNLTYLEKVNEGPGLARNFGSAAAKGDYIIFFDSDCIIPQNYFVHVNNFLKAKQDVDCFGGPDMAHPSFTDIQKAINYSMTSVLTTGGIRGKANGLEKFHPRSFNLGIRKNVFEQIGGFSRMRFGEDIDLSARIVKSGYHTALIPNAGVYHKRRTSFYKFYKQIYNSGIARINLYFLHPEQLKAVHFLPALFVFGNLLLAILSFVSINFMIPILGLIIVFFVDSFIKNKSVTVAFLSIAASFIQLTSYGLGFTNAFFKRVILGRKEFNAFRKNFYK